MNISQDEDVSYIHNMIRQIVNFISLKHRLVQDGIPMLFLRGCSHLKSSNDSPMVSADGHLIRIDGSWFDTAPKQSVASRFQSNA